MFGAFRVGFSRLKLKGVGLALHGDLICRHRAKPAPKLFFTHPPSPGSFYDHIFAPFGGFVF